MLLDDQFIVVKMLNESLGENQIVSSGRHELEKIAFEQLGVGHAVKKQVLPDIRHFIGVINAGDAISEFLGKVNHVVARYATDLDCLSAPGLCQEPREYRMMLEDRALIALPRWQIPPRRIPVIFARRIRHKCLGLFAGNLPLSAIPQDRSLGPPPARSFVHDGLIQTVSKTRQESLFIFFSYCSFAHSILTKIHVILSIPNPTPAIVWGRTCCKVKRSLPACTLKMRVRVGDYCTCTSLRKPV